jgi:signal transduction histidine kinase
MNQTKTILSDGHHAAIPEPERNRLKALDRYAILDTPAEPSFDRVVNMATTFFKVFGAVISFVDLNRVWVKANTSSIKVSYIPRGESLCARAIYNPEITVIADTFLEPGLKDNPFVSGSKPIRFMAAAPLTSHDEFTIGTLCIFDHQPREMTDQENQILQALAAVVMDELELRLSAKQALKLQTEFLNMVVHNLKNPLSGILGLAQLLPDYRHDHQELLEMSSLIADTSEKMLESLNELLHMSRMQASEIRLNLEEVNLVELVRSVVQDNTILARQKNQELTLEEIPALDIRIDRKRVQEIIDNLLSNCIKYTPLGGSIKVVIKTIPDWVRIEFIDNGQGLDEQELQKVFQRFADISSEPTGNESSTGIGLSIVKTLVELHQGNIWAESPGKNKGSKFILELPRKN